MLILTEKFTDYREILVVTLYLVQLEAIMPCRVKYQILIQESLEIDQVTKLFNFKLCPDLKVKLVTFIDNIQYFFSSITI